MSLSLCPRWRNKIYLFIYLCASEHLRTIGMYDLTYSVVDEHKGLSYRTGVHLTHLPHFKHFLFLYLQNSEQDTNFKCIMFQFLSNLSSFIFWIWYVIKVIQYNNNTIYFIETRLENAIDTIIKIQMAWLTGWHVIW